MKLSSLKNRFPVTAFSKGSDGLSRIKNVSLIYDMLETLHEEGINSDWEFKAAGVHPSTGHAYYIGELHLWDGEGTIVRTGVADGDDTAKGYGGLASLALANAMLRGFGMAAFLYEGELDHAPPAPPSKPEPVWDGYQWVLTGTLANQPPQPAPQQAPPQQVVPRQYPPRQGQPPPRSYPPRVWDGTARIKSGTYGPGNPHYPEGYMYKDMDIGVLTEWANKAEPNQQAVKELNRRMALGGMPDASSAFSR